MFKSKLEAYCYTLQYLKKLKKLELLPDEQDAISTVISNLRILIENHEQDIAVLIELLNSLLSSCSTIDKTELMYLAIKIQNSSFIQTDVEKWRNPLGRRFESQIAIGLLLRPTQAMMAITGKVSNLIVQMIEENEAVIETYAESYIAEKAEKILSKFKNCIFYPSHCLTLGSVSKDNLKFSLEEIKNILRQNNSQKLANIIHIHYIFAHYAFKYLPVASSELGKKLTSVQRAYITNGMYNDSPLYTASDKRGRFGLINISRDFLTNQLGIMLMNQDTNGLPKYGQVKWIPDCTAQNVDLNPNTDNYFIVRDMIENDTPYVAGFSGMVSLLMPQMLELCDNATSDEQRGYLCVVLGFIVGGGFHSIHEVIGPCEGCLNLIPGYEVSIPGRILAKPPNFHCFFEYVCKFDSEFSAHLEQTWNEFEEYLDDFDFELSMSRQFSEENEFALELKSESKKMVYKPT